MSHKFAMHMSSPFIGGFAGIGESVSGFIGEALEGLNALSEKALAVIALWRSRRQQRRDLRSLDSRILRDIGLTRPQALMEAYKPFWRA